MHQKPKQVSFLIWRYLSSQRCLLNMFQLTSLRLLWGSKWSQGLMELSFWMGTSKRSNPIACFSVQETNLCIVKLGMEPRASHTEDKQSVPESQPQPSFLPFEKRSLHKLSRPTFSLFCLQSRQALASQPSGLSLRTIAVHHCAQIRCLHSKQTL